MVISQDEKLSQVFRSLSDPTRIQIVRMLSQGERTVLDLAANFRMSQPAVTKHLGVLEKAGVISRTKNGRYRHCRLKTDKMHNAAEWIRKIEDYWNQRLDIIEGLLEAEQKEKEK
ncbi:MAG TPA: metalloregulator ArsR/SmtB family transcription factor [bacterium]|jgi:DNA-binding transcriptional ArsR family regulator